MNYAWNWSVFSQQASATQTYGDWLLQGLLLTVGLGLLAWILALFLGFSLGVARTIPIRALAWPATAYVELFRGIPLIVQLFIWYFVVPELVPFGPRFKSLNPFFQQFVVAVVCLGMFTAARVCEQVRAGLESISVGQTHAAQALGMSRWQTYRFILLPVATRIILPPLTSEFLAVFKNSAVMSTIGLLELAAQGRQLVDYTAQPYEAFIAVTLLFLLINGVVMGLMRLLEHRTRLVGVATGG